MSPLSRRLLISSELLLLQQSQRSCNRQRREGSRYPDERHAIVRDGRKRTILLNLMMNDLFVDLGIETGVLESAESLSVGCVGMRAEDRR